MKKLFLLVLFLSVAASARAQLYIDVTQSPYSANKTCASDDGGIINQAITDALNQSVNTYAAGSTIYFPPGCYLINTQILDPGLLSNGHGGGIGITYLGFGRAVLQAGSTLTGSIIKFGDDTQDSHGNYIHSPSRRHLSTLYFECGGLSVDGIDIGGLYNSEFDDIEIRDCATGINTVGNNPSRWGISIEGGLVGASTAAGNGVTVGPGANFWTIKGMRVAYGGTSTSTGVGMEIEGAGNVCAACDVEGFKIGFMAGQIGTIGGLEISGGYFENNLQSHIRIGTAAAPGDLVHGVSIHGAYLNGGKITQACIDLQQGDGFSIVGNHFNDCLNYNIRGLADSTSPVQEGADNGFVASNTVSISGTNTPIYSLLGKNITFIGPTCVSSASPAACGYTSAGMVALPAGGNSLTVNTPFITATSRITINEDMTLGSSFSPAITCNTVGGRTYSVTAKTAGTSFTITSSTAPATNPACLVFSIQN